MKACCPTCDRLLDANPRELKKGSTRQRNTYVIEHRQPVCPACWMLATFVTICTPGVDATLTDAGGFYTCVNSHSFDEPDMVRGPKCGGHKRPI